MLSILKTRTVDRTIVGVFRDKLITTSQERKKTVIWLDNKAIFQHPQELQVLKCQINETLSLLGLTIQDRGLYETWLVEVAPQGRIFSLGKETTKFQQAIFLQNDRMLYILEHGCIELYRLSLRAIKGQVTLDGQPQKERFLTMKHTWATFSDGVLIYLTEERRLRVVGSNWHDIVVTLPENVELQSVYYAFVSSVDPYQTLTLVVPGVDQFRVLPWCRTVSLDDVDDQDLQALTFMDFTMGGKLTQAFQVSQLIIANCSSQNFVIDLNTLHGQPRVYSFRQVIQGSLLQMNEQMFLSWQGSLMDVKFRDFDVEGAHELITSNPLEAAHLLDLLINCFHMSDSQVYELMSRVIGMEGFAEICKLVVCALTARDLQSHTTEKLWQVPTSGLVLSSYVHMHYSSKSTVSKDNFSPLNVTSSSHHFQFRDFRDHLQQQLINPPPRLLSELVITQDRKVAVLKSQQDSEPQVSNRGIGGLLSRLLQSGSTEPKQGNSLIEVEQVENVQPIRSQLKAALADAFMEDLDDKVTQDVATSISLTSASFKNFGTPQVIRSPFLSTNTLNDRPQSGNFEESKPLWSKYIHSQQTQATYLWDALKPTIDLPKTSYYDHHCKCVNCDGYVPSSNNSAVPIVPPVTTPGGSRRSSRNQYVQNVLKNVTSKPQPIQVQDRVYSQQELLVKFDQMEQVYLAFEELGSVFPGGFMLRFSQLGLHVLDPIVFVQYLQNEMFELSETFKRYFVDRVTRNPQFDMSFAYQVLDFVPNRKRLIKYISQIPDFSKYVDVFAEPDTVVSRTSSFQSLDEPVQQEQQQLKRLSVLSQSLPPGSLDIFEIDVKK